MPSFTTLNLKDRTGAVLAFAARMIAKGWYTWVHDKANTPAIGKPNVTHRSTMDARGPGAHSHEWFINVPRIDAPTQVPGEYIRQPKKVSATKAYLMIQPDPLATQAELEDFMGMLKELVASSVVTGPVTQVDLVR